MMNKQDKKYIDIRKDVMKEYSLTPETELFRYTFPEFLKVADNGKIFITSNKSPIEIVIDSYEDKGHSVHASQVGSGLAFTTEIVEEYESSDRQCIKVKLNDIIEQGGLIYPVVSVPSYIKSFFVTLPDGKVQVSED